MNQLRPFYEYEFVVTPTICVPNFCSKNLYVKLEQKNLNGNIKSRTAYYLIRETLKKKTADNLVESSSGNLGLSLGYFSQKIGIHFLCLVDPTVPKRKIKELQKLQIDYKMIDLVGFSDYRSARIHYAKFMDSKEGWAWTNQYENEANVLAHYETTGPELYSQLNGHIDFIVAAVGSGGTLVGCAKYLKEKNPLLKVVAVEPIGSTIFGGVISDYLTVGSGLNGPSKIVRKHWKLFDYYSQVSDSSAVKACNEFKIRENISVGISTGSVLCVAKELSKLYPNKNIVCISADGGENYIDIVKNININDATIPIIKPVGQNF